MSAYPVFKAAAAHIAPHFLDRAKTVAKACDLIREAAPEQPAAADERVVRFRS